MTAANDWSVRRALEAAGVIFIDENGEGPGVRLRKRPSLSLLRDELPQELEFRPKLDFVFKNSSSRIQVRETARGVFTLLLSLAQSAASRV